MEFKQFVSIKSKNYLLIKIKKKKKKKKKKRSCLLKF